MPRRSEAKPRQVLDEWIRARCACSWRAGNAGSASRNSHAWAFAATFERSSGSGRMSGTRTRWHRVESREERAGAGGDELSLPSGATRRRVRNVGNRPICASPERSACFRGRVQPARRPQRAGPHANARTTWWRGGGAGRNRGTRMRWLIDRGGGDGWKY